MNLSLSFGYAVRGLVALVAHPEVKVSLEDVCVTQGLPKNYMVKIFQRLQTAGLVLAHRGFKGGYLLTKPAVDLSLADIYDAMCDTSGCECLYRGTPCPSQDSATCCKRVIEAATKAEREVLGKVSLQAIYEHTAQDIQGNTDSL